jgi:hypothetical protein
MPTSTTNFGLSKPLVNDPTDADLWGGFLNNDLDSIDGLFITALEWTPSMQTSTISITAPTIGSTSTGSAKNLYLCNATGGAFPANLPAASTCSGMVVAFKKTDASANVVTITANGSDKIDGVGTFSLNGQYSFLVISSDGVNWDIISTTPPAIQSASTTVAGILMTATSAIALAGTDAATALTAAAFSGNKLISANGYYKLPGGLVIQWGQTGGIPGVGSLPVLFPTAFPTTAFMVVFSDSTATSGFQASNYTSNLTTTGFTVHNQGNNGVQVYWLAIGN